MLTEDQIRNLLLKAGNSVATDHAVPPPAAASERQPWRTAGAAIAVAATLAVIAGAGFWLTGEKDPADDTPLTPSLVTGVPEGTVPSVFAHTRASATEMLERLGVRVEFRQENSCDPEGRPIGTDPATGIPYEQGGTVTVLLAHHGPTTDCMADLTEPWTFMDFANRRGPSPRFADEVRLFVDGEPTKTLTGADAESGKWGTPSALSELRTASDQVLKVGGVFTAPTLQVQTGTPPDESCEIPQPGALGGREALTLTVDIPIDGQFHCPSRVSIYRTAGQIDAVVTWTERPLGSPPPARPIPDVVGMKVEPARAAITAAGHTATVEELETCHPREGVVVEQAPDQQDIIDDLPEGESWTGPVTLVVEVPHTTRPCAALDAAAQGFIRFARGGAPPLWADEVEQLLGYPSFNRVTAQQADDPTAWSFCSGVSPADCKLSPLVVIADAEQVVAAENRHSYGCEFIDYGGLPTEVLSDDEIHIFPGEAGCEKQWDISLWIDDAGRIIAINLLVPEAR